MSWLLIMVHRTPTLASCCGLSLKHGTIIIGVVQSIFAFMCLVLSAAYAEHPRELIEMNDPFVVSNLDTLKVVLTMIAIASAMQFIFSILLVFGAASNNPAMLIPWLILNPICLVIYVFGTFVAIAYHSSADNTPFIIAHMLASFFVIMLVSYKTMVVYSYRKYLKRQNF